MMRRLSFTFYFLDHVPPFWIRDKNIEHAWPKEKSHYGETKSSAHNKVVSHAMDITSRFKRWTSFHFDGVTTTDDGVRVYRQDAYPESGKYGADATDYCVIFHNNKEQFFHDSISLGCLKDSLLLQLSLNVELCKVKARNETG